MLRHHTSQSWKKHRARILNFITRYGEKKITLASLHSLRALSNEQLNVQVEHLPPASIVTYTEQGALLGVAYAIADGSGHCIVVVHPDARRRGIGSKLMEALIQSLPSFSCQVAIDNVASLALCFNNELHAVAMFKGPTGKSTLRFERRFMNASPNIRNSNPVS
ncbi:MULTISPECIES: GNAT family N-acetyltransferase [Paenibacillus]|uniref:GNAT family N-acetyltransferase n=1 Tax=Paenibacillus TaxID=44249 RepID=UPI0020410A10|nr:GNAT family N-acetyltransferase [Paenibacillus camelliae]MCM3632531.1 GNAT family N-acetyltransferase [Paenibacillus camelliae]